MTDLRKQVDGRYTTEELSRLTWPVAWSGVVSAVDAAAQEADVHALVKEAREAIEEAGLFCDDLADKELVAVIQSGELVEIAAAE